MMNTGNTSAGDGRVPISNTFDGTCGPSRAPGTHDETELHAFAARLCGLGGLGTEEMMEAISGLAIPTHFADIRVTNLDRDHWVFLTKGNPLRQMKLYEVMIGFSFLLDHELEEFHNEGVWHETVALPIVDPSRLELGIRFRPRLPSDSTEEWILPETEFNAIVHGEGGGALPSAG